VLLLAVLLDVSRAEFIALSIVVMIVLAAELLNTALEAAIDLFSSEVDPRARAAKDVAAGAVLVAAFGALVVGYVILFPPLRKALTEGLQMVRHSKPDIALVALIIVLILVILTKALTGKGSPLRGGLPSGHAAVSFSLWMSVVFITGSAEASILVALMAAALSSSRVVLKIHSIWEVILGALLGITVTFLLFLSFA